MKWLLLFFLFLNGCSETDLSSMSDLEERTELESKAKSEADSKKKYETLAKQKAELEAKIKSEESKMITKPSKNFYGSAETHTDHNFKNIKPPVDKKQVSDLIVKQLHLSSIAFNIPDTANVKDHIDIQLLIDPAKTEEELSALLTSKLSRQHTTVLISKVVTAKIIAPEFVVINITEETQAIIDSIPTEWRWNLTPKSYGTFEIHLTISAIIKVDDDSVDHSIKTFDKTMIINITPWQMIKMWVTDDNHFQWIWSALLLPILPWIIKKLKIIIRR